MSTSVRYKAITNGTGAALTAAGITDTTDGNDKQYRIITRTLVAADIGNGAGQTQNANGCLVEQLPATTNVLLLEGATYRGGRGIDNLTLSSGAQIANITYSVNASNQVVVVDAGSNAAVQLAAGDVIVAKVISGPTP